MKIPLDWLNRLVPVTLAPADLAELLTISGLEVESIDDTPDGVVLDVDILPNMARCLSMLGAAREVAALTRAPLPVVPPLAELPAATEDRMPAVQEPSVCGRFLALEVSGVGGIETPPEIAARLRAAGVGAVNGLVDLANYVMIEIGQPIHVYDRDTLDGGLLGLRLATPGDRLLLLTQPPDAPPRELPAGTPLIVDRHGAPATVAGLVGGRDTAVRPSTTAIVVEAATFDFLAIRRAQAALALRTDASARFSRGVPASLAETGTRRFLHLLEEIRPELRVESFGEWALDPPPPRRIRLPLGHLEQAIGTRYEADDALAVLAHLGLAAECHDGVIEVVVGDEREDLAIPEDLVEEVVRIAGYDRLRATMPTGEMPLPLRDERRSAAVDVREAMVRAGLSEIISYTFTSPRAHVAAGGRPEDRFVELVNPLSPERSVVRRSLLPGLLEAVESNLRHGPSVDLFEQGVVALPELAGLDARLPHEAGRLAFAIAGSAEPGARWSDADAARAADFFDAADIVHGLARHLHVDGLQLDPAEAEPYVAGACAAVVHDGTVLGHIGLVQPPVAERFGIRERDVFAGELDAGALEASRRVEFAVREPSRFPDVRLDLSVAVSTAVAGGALVAAARAAGGPRLRDVWIFDVYAGAGVAAGSRAVGLRLSVGDDERTLTTEEATAVRDAIVAALAAELGAAPR